MNTVGIIGRATKDTEVRTTQNNRKFVSFCIAVKKGITEDASFIDCVAWGNQADFIGRNVKKGTQVAIQGELETHTYSDSNGVNRKVTEVLIHKIDIIWKKQEKQEQIPSEEQSLPLTIEEPEETPPTFVEPKEDAFIDDTFTSDLPFEV